MALKRMDNVGIVVDDLAATIDFFRELGLELEGRATIEGEWAGRVTGLGDQRVEIAMMRTPDGHGRLELSRFLTPPAVADHRNAPVNALGYLRVMFAVDDIDETLVRLRKRGAQLVGEVVQYEHSALRLTPDEWQLRLDDTAWGQGFATEAAGAVLQWAFDTLDLNRVQSGADTRNRASERVLEKLGFVREGT